MEHTLKLNEYHNNVLLSYTRFADYQREQCLKTIKESFDKFRFSSVMEDTFTSDEVRDLIDDLSCLIIEDLKSDLVNITHTVVLLLCQMCSQAQQWCLNLQADTSELENKELLEKVKEFYENLHGGNGEKVSGSPIKLLTKLKPLGDDSAPINLLNEEINRLKEENTKLCARIKDVQNKAIEIIEEKSAISKALDVANDELSKLKEKQVEMMEQKMYDLEKLKSELEASLEEKMMMQDDLERNLEETKQRLSQAEAQCQLTVKELEQKFSETTAYHNMKQILAAKNEQIKDLRRLLKQLKPSDEDDEKEEESDQEI